MPEINITQARILIEAALMNEEKVKTLTPTERKALKVMIQEVKQWDTGQGHKGFWIRGTSYDAIEKKLFSLNLTEQSSRIEKVMKGIGNFFGTTVSSKKLLDSAKEIQPQQLPSKAKILDELSKNEGKILASSPSPAIKPPELVKLEKEREELYDQLELCVLKEEQEKVNDPLFTNKPVREQLTELRDKYRQLEFNQGLRGIPRGTRTEKIFNITQYLVVKARFNKLNSPKRYADAFVHDIRHEIRSPNNIRKEMNDLLEEIQKLENPADPKIRFLMKHHGELGKELKKVKAQEAAQKKITGTHQTDNPLFSPPDPQPPKQH